MTPPNIKRIAELCGVSRGTVDRVLNGRPGVNAATAARVRGVIAQLGYKPNAVGRALVRLKDPRRIGVVLSPDYNAFVADVRRGVAEASREFAHLGVRVDVRAMRTLEGREQVAILEELVAAGVDALALLPIEAPEVVEKLRALVVAGMPVVTLNSDLPEIDRLCFVGQDHVAGGRVAGSLMGRIVRAGPVGVISSSRGLLCHVQRLRGFEEKLRAAYPRIMVTQVLENEDRDDLARDAGLALLRDRPDLAGIYLTGGGAAGLAAALREAGRAGAVRVVTHDFVPSTVELVKAGIFDFAIGQDPVAQGYLPIKILHAFLLDHRRPPAPFVPTRIDIRTDDNIEDAPTERVPSPPVAPARSAPRKRAATARR